MSYTISNQGMNGAGKLNISFAQILDYVHYQHTLYYCHLTGQWVEQGWKILIGSEAKAYTVKWHVTCVLWTNSGFLPLNHLINLKFLYKLNLLEEEMKQKIGDSENLTA